MVDNYRAISWLCKKQTSVSHSSTESETISLDAGLRMVGISALDHWDLFFLKCCILLPTNLRNPKTNVVTHHQENKP